MPWLLLLKSPWAWVAVAFAGLGAYAGLQHIEAVEARAEVAKIKLQWAEANTAAQAEADKQRKIHAATAQEADVALQQSQIAAEDFKSKWDQARREARNARTALVSCPNTPGSSTTNATEGADAGVPRLSYEFLREYDTAWTGPDGKPVFSDPPRPAEALLGAASPVTSADALETHRANAERCSDNRRQLDVLTTLIRKLQAQ